MATEFLSQLPGWELVLFIALVIIFFLATVITCLVILSKQRWPFRYVVTEDVSGSGHQITKRGRARLIAFGDGGEEIFYLKNLKKYRLGYGKRIGPKQVLWSVGSDGYWYNVTFGDIDKKLQELGINPVHVNVRLATSSMRKGIENRYNKADWLSKYGALVYAGVFLLALMIFGGIMYFAFDKQADISNTFAQTVEVQNQLSERLATAAENLARAAGQSTEQNTGGSGIAPVATIPPNENG